jgi:hypothetical protein
MKICKISGIVLSVCFLFTQAAWAVTPVEGSSEDLYWSEPMTVHDFKKKNDLHSIAISAMAVTELQFVRLGDGLLNATGKNRKSPISRSLDSLEYAYSRLPRIEPVRRFGQFFNALQLRQVSLSDARLLGSVLTGGIGGVTPIMQVRVYNVVVWLEDVVYDLDSAIMSPVNWGISSLREKPTHIKSLGYVADGLGYLRWETAAGVKYINRKIARLSSDAVMGIEKIQDALIRSKRRKQQGQLQVYAKMPLSVFQENQSYFTGKKANVTAGTLAEWSEKKLLDAALLPQDIQGAELRIENIAIETDPSREILLSVDYLTWEKTPRELKKYVITSEELTELVRSKNPLAPVAKT